MYSIFDWVADQNMSSSYYGLFTWFDDAGWFGFDFSFFLFQKYRVYGYL